jgi:hypothetical protein
MHHPGTQVECPLWLHHESGLDCQCPQHRLEGIRRPAVRVLQHAAHGCGTCALHPDRVERGSGDHPGSQCGIGDCQCLVEREPPSAVQHRPEGRGDARRKVVGGEVHPHHAHCFPALGRDAPSAGHCHLGKA